MVRKPTQPIVKALRIKEELTTIKLSLQYTTSVSTDAMNKTSLLIIFCISHVRFNVSMHVSWFADTYVAALNDVRKQITHSCLAALHSKQVPFNIGWKCMFSLVKYVWCIIVYAQKCSQKDTVKAPMRWVEVLRDIPTHRGAEGSPNSFWASNTNLQCSSLVVSFIVPILCPYRTNIYQQWHNKGPLCPPPPMRVADCISVCN